MQAQMERREEEPRAKAEYKQPQQLKNPIMVERKEVEPYHIAPHQNLDYPPLQEMNVVPQEMNPHILAPQQMELNYPRLPKEKIKEEVEESQNFDSFKVLTELKNQNGKFEELDIVFEKRGPVITHIPTTGSIQNFALSEDSIFEITQPKCPTPSDPSTSWTSRFT
jgi:hypothetical protein